MYQLLERANISTAGQRGYHILGRSAQDGLICFGAPSGKQQTFILLDEWAPKIKNLEREDALAELARRYFTSHGPATIEDFIGWTSLTATDARAGLEMTKADLISETVDGQMYWMSSKRPRVKRDSATAYLLSAFDEYMLGYKDRSASLEAQYARYIWPGGGTFSPTIVIDGRVVGTWKRTFKKGTVVVVPSPFTSLSEGQKRAIAVAAERYGKFVGMSVILGRL
jgi:hypothetical protein